MSLDYCDTVFSKALAAEGESEFFHHIQALAPFYKILSVEVGRGKVYWRARKIADKPFNKVDDVIYPPAKNTNQGRLNDKYEPCLYVSKNMETALLEIDAEEGSLIQLAGFRVKLGHGIRLALIGEIANVQKTGYIRFSGSNPAGTVSKIINDMPLKDALRAIYIDKFYSQVLADLNARNENYFRSRALGKFIHSQIPAEGIAFPSIKDQGGYNLAINPSIYDENMHNVSCLIVKIIRKRSYGILEYEIIKSAKKINSDNQFCWNSSQVPYNMGLYNMTKDEYDFMKKKPPNKHNIYELLQLYE